VGHKNHECGSEDGKTQSKIKRNGERYRCFFRRSGLNISFKSGHDVLGNKVLAVTARSAAFPERELKDAENFASNYGILLRL